MNDMTTTRMLSATAALAAVAALFASPATSMIPRTPDEPGTIPYLSDAHLLGWGPAQATAGQQIQSYLDQQLKPNFRMPKTWNLVPKAKPNGARSNEGQVALTESRAGSTRYGYVVGGEFIGER
jgi:hypothetical protein